MGFVVSESSDCADAVALILWIDAKGKEAKDGENEESDSTKLTFFLRPKWRGRDLRRINDAMYVNDERGVTRPQFGTSARKKMVCGVLSIEGIETPDGKVPEQMTDALYDALPGWVTEKVLRKLNELNADGEPKEGE